MADETLLDSSERDVLAEKLPGYKEKAGKVSGTGIYPGMWVKETAASTVTAPEYELCSAGDVECAGIVKWDLRADITAALTDAGPIVVITGGAIVNTLCLENIGDCRPGKNAVLSGTDGYSEPATATQATAWENDNIVLGTYENPLAQDTQYKKVVQIRLKRG